MKTNNAHRLIKFIAVIGATTILATSLHAGRGGNTGSQGGNAGQCPQGFEPGTRMQQDCPRPQDGSGRKSTATGKKTNQGSGKKAGNGNGTRDGSGNRADCPNLGS